MSASETEQQVNLTYLRKRTPSLCSDSKSFAAASISASKPEISPVCVCVKKRRSGWKAESHSATADWNLATRLCKIPFKEFLPHPGICCKKLCESDNASYIIPLASALRKSQKHGSKKKNVNCNTARHFDDLSRTFVCQCGLAVLSHSSYCEVWFRFSGVCFVLFFFLMC